MIQEYKWGLGYLIASIFLGQTLNFSNGIVLANNTFTTILSTTLIIFVDPAVLITLLCFLISACYFYYGYRRSHNRATMTEYKICTYLLPSWKRIKWSLMIPLILLLIVYVVDWASGLGVDEPVFPKEFSESGFQRGGIFAPKTLGSSMFFSNSFEFTTLFFLVAIYIYILFSLVMRIAKISWLTKTMLILFIIFIILVTYFVHNLKANAMDAVGGDCDKANRYVPLYGTRIKDGCIWSITSREVVALHQDARKNNETASPESIQNILQQCNQISDKNLRYNCQHLLNKTDTK